MKDKLAINEEQFSKLLMLFDSIPTEKFIDFMAMNYLEFKFELEQPLNRGKPTANSILHITG